MADVTSWLKPSSARQTGVGKTLRAIAERIEHGSATGFNDIDAPYVRTLADWFDALYALSAHERDIAVSRLAEKSNAIAAEAESGTPVRGRDPVSVVRSDNDGKMS